MLKKLIKDKSHDELLLNIQSAAFIIMIICLLSVFLINKFLPFLIRWVFLVFIVSAIFGFGIIMIWVIRDFISYKENIYDPSLKDKQEGHSDEDKGK